MTRFKTEHFSLREFIKSETADKYNIDNTPSEDVISNLYNLVTCVLEPARAKLNAPIFINSGYRSVELNKRVKGQKNSQHLKGEAADLRCSSLSILRDLFDILKTLPIDQLLYEWTINYKGQKVYWIHVSYKLRGNRNMVIDNYRASSNPNK